MPASFHRKRIMNNVLRRPVPNQPVLKLLSFGAAHRRGNGIARRVGGAARPSSLITQEDCCSAASGIRSHAYCRGNGSTRNCSGIGRTVALNAGAGALLGRFGSDHSRTALSCWLVRAPLLSRRLLLRSAVFATRRATIGASLRSEREPSLIAITLSMGIMSHVDRA